MNLSDFIRQMPKVEIHVHLEGATRPRTLINLAQRHNIPLPTATIEGIREWYRFVDFSHFLDIYRTISEAIRTPDDIELLTREFLQGQADQNIVYSEVTYTPYTHYVQKGLPFDEQLAAINRARRWAEQALGVKMGLVLDIPHMITAEEGMMTADWAISAMGNGVIAFGLGGPEVGHPPEKFAAAFAKTNAAGLPPVPHAGETVGPESIRGALDSLKAVRIGHGVRCTEDPELVAELRDRQIPLEVCPTSNVCLGVVPSFEQHPLPQLIDEGLYVTINSDDPPMFNTTLTDEFLLAAQHFGFDTAQIQALVMNALNASFIPDDEKSAMVTRFNGEFAALHGQSSL